MKPYFVEPERLKGLLASAEKHLGLSPEEAKKHVTNYLKDEAVRYAKNPKTFFRAYTFANRLAPRGRGIDDEVDRAIVKEKMAQALHRLEQLEASFTLTNGIRANLKTWAKYPSWTQLEAVYVMRGLDINKIMSKNYILTEASKSNFPTFKQINETDDLAQRCVRDGVIGANAHPVEWLSWSKDYDVPVIENLPQLVLEHFQKTMTPERKAKFDALVEEQEKDDEVKPDQKQSDKFILTPLSTTYGYLPVLEEVLDEARQAGEPIPSPEDAYDRMVEKKPKLVTFHTENRTLTYIGRDGEISRTVNLAAIKKAINKRTKSI